MERAERSRQSDRSGFEVLLAEATVRVGSIRMGKGEFKKEMPGRKILVKPIIVVELAVILLLAGVGVAYAYPQHTITSGATPWVGTASITESGDLTVTDYDLIFNAELTQVTGVTIEVTNSDVWSHIADIDVAILDSGGVFKSGETVTRRTCQMGASVHSVSTTTPVALEDADRLNIVITDRGQLKAEPIPFVAAESPRA